jgi:hypothetical protein
MTHAAFFSLNVVSINLFIIGCFYLETLAIEQDTHDVMIVELFKMTDCIVTKRGNE